jgi:hypothetical protein
MTTTDPSPQPAFHFPQGMDFFKQFVTQNPALQALNPTISPPPTVNTALAQAMSQYMMPTLDLAELDKRLNDLRIVLQFMEMNTTVLRQSLQSLELQRTAVANFNQMMQAPSSVTSNTNNTGT